MYKYILLCFVFLMQIRAQDIHENTATFFDDSKSTEYYLENIIISGEVESEAVVDFSKLPLKSFPFKDVTLKPDGKRRFVGSYYVTGYSLYDLIANVKVKKVNEKDFNPLVDMFVIVENAAGDKAVFSWGELFYTKDNSKSIIVKNIAPINPSKSKMEWPIAESPRLICGYDLSNDRFISNPTKIILKSAPGEYSTKRMDDIYVPEMKIVKDDKEVMVGDLKEPEREISFEHVGYGHGRGFKGIKERNGLLLKDVLNSFLDFNKSDIRSGLVILSAKDGYRVTYSLSEIINRNDLEALLLLDCGETKDAGRYRSFMTSDFFVDRNVRSIEKVEIINCK